MNTMEAVASGFPFKRPQDENWFHVRDGEILYRDNCEGWTVPYMLAEDWLTREPPITLTSEQYRAAAEQALPSIQPDNAFNYLFRQQFAALAKLLGLGPDPRGPETRRQGT